MEVGRVENLLIYSLTFILLADLLFAFDGLLVPLALTFLLLYILYLHIKSVFIILALIPLVMFVFYFLKFNRVMRKIRNTQGGYIDTRIFSIPFISKKIREKLQHSEDVYYTLIDQFGYVIRGFGDNSYMVRFNIGAFGKTKFVCYSEEKLERGSKVQVKTLKNGKIYIERA